MLRESLLATEGLKDRLYINRRFHWRLYIDVSLIAYCWTKTITDIRNRFYYSPPRYPTLCLSSH
jgi:hypothetical protein